MKKINISGYLIVLSAVLLCHAASAANLQVKVIDNSQSPVDFAVVYINEVLPPLDGGTTVVDQVDKEFIPYVTAVQRGSNINFLNSDNIRHQVYSFSATKQFEVPLYKGNPLHPVAFDTAGAVPIACNIHDWMSAYVYVVDTNKFVVTDTLGAGSIGNLDNGEYEVLVWHPKLDGSAEATAQSVTISGGDKAISFTVNKKQMLRAWRAPRSVKRREY